MLPAGLMARPMNAIGQLVNLKQVHRGALFPLSLCVCMCVCVLSQGVIDWTSECLCHREAEERTEVRANAEIEACEGSGCAA